MIDKAILKQITHARIEAEAYGRENEDEFCRASHIALAYEVGVLRGVLEQIARAVEHGALVPTDNHLRAWLPHWAKGGE